MSLFGRDFFKIIKFAMIIIKLFATVFGDDEDRQNGNADLNVKVGDKEY